jgi:hypothetical protein
VLVHELYAARPPLNEPLLQALVLGADHQNGSFVSDPLTKSKAVEPIRSTNLAIDSK